MAGYSDVPFRRICRRMGAAASYTPLALDEGIIHGTPQTVRIIDAHPDERPLIMQVVGQDAQRLLEAARHLLDLTPDVIDVNFGCPAKRVTAGGRGASLLRTPARIGQIVETLATNLPVPVTAKIRLGWDDESLTYLEVARVLEQSGAAAITVHGRTRVQGYSGCADWEAIGQVRASVRVPVIANGDVRTSDDIEAIKRVTGCELVMIGRGAIGNPWIFQRRDVRQVPMTERVPVMREHLRAMVAYYGPRIGLLQFRKHAVNYVRYASGASVWRRRVATADTPQALESVLDGLADMSLADQDQSSPD
jgi:tRNA-dihydrouridine synthase B